MSVEPEKLQFFCYSGQAVPAHIHRGANGQWSGAINVAITVHLRDGREIIFKKQIRLRATEQRGRKPPPSRR